MRVDDFDFDLPSALIAQAPAAPREAARLLHVAEALDARSVGDLPDFFAAGDALVVNDTKVLPCRLTGFRERAGARAKIEVTLHKPCGADRWRAFARPAKKLKLGETIQFAPEVEAAFGALFEAPFEAKVAEKFDGGEIELVFNVSGPALLVALEKHGIMPLPPYIKRAAAGRDTDRADYQTLFAARPGAVAAPTAGLHFTAALLAALEAKGVKVVRLTLHVGAGTFLPVTSDDTVDHVMHAEWADLSAEAAATLNEVRQAGGRITAVGSTALRTLESAANADGVLQAFTGETDLFITPGYRFLAVDRMLTNFHLPRSTLFMLVSAFAGLDRMRAAYAHAIAAKYRFFSYGDACLLEPDPATWTNARHDETTRHHR